MRYDLKCRNLLVYSSLERLFRALSSARCFASTASKLQFQAMTIEFSTSTSVSLSKISFALRRRRPRWLHVVVVAESKMFCERGVMSRRARRMIESIAILFVFKKKKTLPVAHAPSMVSRKQVVRQLRRCRSSW